MNHILDKEQMIHIRNMPTFVCGQCGRGDKKLYLLRRSKQIGKWKWQEIMEGICKECLDIHKKETTFPK